MGKPGQCSVKDISLPWPQCGSVGPAHAHKPDIVCSDAPRIDRTAPVFMITRPTNDRSPFSDGQPLLTTRTDDQPFAISAVRRESVRPSSPGKPPASIRRISRNRKAVELPHILRPISPRLATRPHPPQKQLLARPRSVRVKRWARFVPTSFPHSKT